jgi:hypothetical protein
MTGLRDALDDMAAEITPADPPLDAAMRRGRRLRIRRRAQAITGMAAGIAVLAVGAVAGISALTGQPAPAGPPASSGGPQTITVIPPRIAPVVPVARPVLLVSGPGGGTAYGDASEVNAATLRLFHKLSCPPEPSSATVSDQWKAALGYTAAQWNAPGSEVVSCDAVGDKYVLGKAVITGSEITSISVSRQPSDGQYVIGLALDGRGSTAFAQLTTRQFASDYPGFMQHRNQDDGALDSIAFVVNGDVQSAPETAGPITGGQLQLAGQSAAGYTEAQAQALAAQL